MKAERLLAELDRLRKDLKQDKSNPEWLALHPSFCFISDKMTDFRKYIAEERQKGSFAEATDE